jgi:D-glycero-alpha-D-manno-heptose-7-phosphate kinase
VVITRTPFRISLFGGGSDFPSWYETYGGSVVSFAIDKYCYITARFLPPFFEHKYRIAYSQVETVSRVEDIKHPAVRESLKFFSADEGVEIHHDGDLPARSGVGSSSAFAVGITHALSLLTKNFEPDKYLLAQEAISLEQVRLKENVGSQDQIASAFGGFNFIKFCKKPMPWEVNPININKNIESQLLSGLYLIYSGISRFSSDISAGLTENIVAKKSAIERVVTLAEQCRELLENNGNVDDVGHMLHESWVLKARMNALSMNERLQEMYRGAQSCGATGGKVLGAGGGGFLLFYVPADFRERFESCFKLGTRIPIAIDREGSTCILNS